jgi:hypothetical protein
MKQITKLFAAAGLLTASVALVQAQPYYAAGAGLTPSWNATDPATQLIQTGSGPDVYSNTLPSTANTIYEFKIASQGWSSSWPSGNAKIKGDPNGTNTFYFYPGVSADGWTPVADRVGYNDPGNMTWGVAGDFDGWDGTQLQLTSIGNGVFSNSVTVATAGTYGYKFQSPPGSWNDVYFGANMANGGDNGSFTTTNASQTVSVILDLPHGRWLIGNLAPPPVTNTVVFAVDMTHQIELGLFNPGTDSVYVSGGFNGWHDPTTTLGLLLVNDPPYMGGSNTNIYYGQTNFVGAGNSVVTEFKFTQNDPGALNVGWESSNNRQVRLLTTNGTLVMPPPLFSNLRLPEILTAPASVYFSVDMNGAVGTDTHPFNPSSDNVYINGSFANWYSWSGGITPVSAPAGYQMIQSNNSTIYTNTIILPAGVLVSFDYKYGMDAGGVNGGPSDDEAPAYQNHHRVVRATAMNPYVLPVDRFANMYSEPLFTVGYPTGTSDSGYLTVGAASAGKIPVSWLGCPGARLQYRSNLAAGSWQDLPDTDGTNWITGYLSTNGFVSVTNWPATDNVMFRLMKP